MRSNSAIFLNDINFLWNHYQSIYQGFDYYLLLTRDKSGNSLRQILRIISDRDFMKRYKTYLAVNLYMVRMKAGTVC